MNVPVSRRYFRVIKNLEIKEATTTLSSARPGSLNRTFFAQDHDSNEKIFLVYRVTPTNLAYLSSIKPGMLVSVQGNYNPKTSVKGAWFAGRGIQVQKALITTPELDAYKAVVKTLEQELEPAIA